MDYEKMIVDVWNDTKNKYNGKNTALIANFVRAAKQAEEGENIRSEQFFDGCKTLMERMKMTVKMQLKHNLFKTMDLYEKYLVDLPFDENGNSVEDKHVSRCFKKTIAEYQKAISGVNVDESVQPLPQIVKEERASINFNHSALKTYLHGRNDTPNIDDIGKNKNIYLDYEDVNLFITAIIAAKLQSDNEESEATTEPVTSDAKLAQTLEHNTAPNTLSKNNKQKTNRPFSEYLHNFPDKDALMAKLHELLDEHTSGREVAKVLEALESINCLIKREYTVPYVIKVFNIKCSRTSITNYLGKKDGNGKSIIPQDEIQQIIDILD